MLIPHMEVNGMKYPYHKLAITLCLLYNLPAFAESSTKICKDFEELAGYIMTARQKGVSMSAVWSKIDDFEANERTEEAHRIFDLARTYVKSAYDSPQYSTNEFRERSINTFKDVAFLSCVRKSTP